MNSLNEKAISTIDELLQMDKEDLLMKFENHIEGDFGAILNRAGFFNLGDIEPIHGPSKTNGSGP